MKDYEIEEALRAVSIKLDITADVLEGSRGSSVAREMAREHIAASMKRLQHMDAALKELQGRP